MIGGRCYGYQRPIDGEDRPCTGIMRLLEPLLFLLFRQRLSEANDPPGRGSVC